MQETSNTSHHSNNPRIVFWGTPDIAKDTLAALYEAGYIIAAVVTAPDRPVGRKHVITPPPVKKWASEHAIPVLQPERITPAFSEELATYNPTLSVVVAYGNILPKEAIDIPKKGTLNIHYSLLPRHRGASPVEAALLAGDDTTGVTIQQMIPQLDAGPIVAQMEVDIDEHETKPELLSRLTRIGSTVLLDTLPTYLAGDSVSIPQDDSQATYAPKITKADGEITYPGNDLYNWRAYRAYKGWPGVYFFTAEGLRVKITEATYENTTFIPKKVIPAGKGEMTFAAFKHHYTIAPPDQGSDESNA